ncbi:MAG TPA: SIR2 family protein [Longimicrobium sp.]
MLDEILALPGNRAAFQDLSAVLAAREAIAFVGAGASAGIYPLWDQFIEQMGDYAVAQGKADAQDRARWKGDRTSTPQQRVSTIVRKLGPAHYHQFLRETFGARRGPDRKAYTRVHEALLRLPFRGYVTTNYDSGLEFARAEVRPACLTTGTPTWQDEDEVHRWLTGDVFRSPDACPILWLHGHWNRPVSIVLDLSQYLAAYRPGLYRKTFERLWQQDRLVFVGFGFSDPLFTFLVGEMLRDAGAAHAVPRHVALMGLPYPDDGSPPDVERVHEQRDALERDFHVRPLFYRIKPRPGGGEDHGELAVLLDALAAAEPSAAPPPRGGRAAAPAAAPYAPSGAGAFAESWVHETTDDERFTGRAEARARLDRWVRDPAVRALGVTAVGGSGKTALVGHWLKRTDGWRSRPFTGVFGWSFYQELDSARFLESFLDWAHHALGAPAPGEAADPVAAALRTLQAHPLVVVLDGLEVLQEGQDNARFGRFLDPRLHRLLVGMCTREHASLAVLTSRFVFADLSRYLGTAFHQLDLPGLAPQDGAALLGELEVYGRDAERREVSRRLEGHPLALRVFAEAVPDALREQPRLFLQRVLQAGELRANAPLTRKVRRLLAFYEERLPASQVDVLRVVSLFRAPVAEETIEFLATALFARKRRAPAADTIAARLRTLLTRGILTRELVPGGYGYAAHPILRDHFREAWLRAEPGTARRAADLLVQGPSGEDDVRAERSYADDVLLGGRPSGEDGVQEMGPVLVAVELLLDIGLFPGADRLFVARLGGWEAFWQASAVTDGLRCVSGFVRDAERRARCEQALSRRTLGFYLFQAGVLARLAGHLDLAEEFYRDAEPVQRKSRDRSGLCATLCARADLLIACGRLAEAMSAAKDALALADEDDDEMYESLGDAHAACGRVHAVLGDAWAAAREFAFADMLSHQEISHLSRVWRLASAELQLRLGDAGRALSLLAELDAGTDVAACALTAACALSPGRVAPAEKALARADGLLDACESPDDLAAYHLAAGALALARDDAAGAASAAAAALALAQPLGMRLAHTDALVCRGRAHVLKAEEAEGETERGDWLARALDDGEYALRLARECGYAWAEKDALLLLARVHEGLAGVQAAAADEAGESRHREQSRLAQEEAAAYSARLLLSKEDLKKVEKAARSELHERGIVWTWGL